MKIVLATSLYPPEIGGPAMYTKELCARLHTKHDITVVAYTDKGQPLAGVNLSAVNKSGILPIRLSKFFLAVWQASKGADLIYAQNAMAAGLPVVIVSILKHKPFVLKFVGDEAWERASQHRLTQKRLEEFLIAPEGGWKIKMMVAIQGFVLRHATMVMTPSVHLRKKIIEAYRVNSSRVMVNYNATEKIIWSPFTPQLVKHQIITTARLVTWKGTGGIIRAVAILKQKFSDVRLIVAGDGPEMDSLRELTRQLNLTEKIKFLGNISQVETWHWRKNSEVYVLNSTYEGLPHTVLTSFAALIPVVATNIPGTNEVVYHEKTGLLVEPDQPEQLATMIERLFNDPDLGKKLVQNGAKLLAGKFSWPAHLKILNGIFQTVVAKPYH